MRTQVNGIINQTNWETGSNDKHRENRTYTCNIPYMCHFLHFNMQHYVSEAIVNVAGVLL